MADVNEPSDVDEWAEEPSTLSSAEGAGTGHGGDDGEGEQEAQLYYADVGLFVTAFLAPAYRRTFDGRSRTWCPAWWKHAEAISRLEALWRAWEYLRREPALGMSTWWRDHVDPHMAVLMSAEGPFRHCDPEKGHSDRLRPLPLEEYPADLFTGQ